MPDHFTDEEVEALKAGLEGVTPGPWGVLGSDDENWIIRPGEKIDLIQQGYDMAFRDADAAHIARCSPDAIRRLLARLEQAEARVKELEAYAREATKAITGLTVGGSEFFGKRIGEMYVHTADLPYCVEHIRDRDRRNHERLAAALKEPKP